MVLGVGMLELFGNAEMDWFRFRLHGAKLDGRHGLESRVFGMSDFEVEENCESA